MNQLTLIDNNTPGWSAPANLTIEEWREFGAKIGQANGALNWIAGDWLLAADGKWGEMYDEAERITGWSYDKLKQCKAVANCFNLLDRSNKLSWSHHWEIYKSGGEKKLEYLQIAECNGLSKRELIALIEADKLPAPESEEETEMEPEPEPNSEGWFCPHCGSNTGYDIWAGVPRCNACGVALDTDTDDESDSESEAQVDQPEQEQEQANERQIPKYITVDVWSHLSDSERAIFLDANEMDAGKTFNRQDTDNIEWALWSWNPVTGCLHNCPYCYARDIANRFYEQKFEPALIPSQLSAPANTRVPDLSREDNPVRKMGLQNVFTCSMADLFGKWVPAEWIEAVLEQIRHNPQWNFLLLTKFPVRMAEFDYPPNVWLGTSVDHQWAVERAEKAFKKIKASGFSGVCWLSCEPMMERLTFSSLDMFDWVVIGGASRSTQTKEFRPPREWVNHLEAQADQAGAKVYEKTNLLERIREYPA